MADSIDPARLEELFDKVVDLEPAEASRVLEVECASLPALRRAVESLLDRDRRATARFLEHDGSLAMRAIRAGAAPDAKPNAELRESERIGRYLVLRRIGEGGMGSVYLAYDESLDRRIALKMLRGAWLPAEWLEREAHALARLAHPNVVHVYEIGEHRGQPFVAMELVQGVSLGTWLELTAREPIDILRIFVQAGRGLEAAHAAGVVHGDFKPDNVLVSTDGRARVVDFGVAVLGTGDDDGPLGFAGTPSYMAPEQFLGDRATEASDQFAFCVALYRALFHEAPFAGEGVDGLRAQVTAGALRSPPRVPDVPAWVTPILLRGLARYPGARFDTMRELLEAIDRRLPRDPDLDPNVGRRERVWLAAGLVCCAAAIIAVLCALGGPSRAVATPRALLVVACVPATAIAVGVSVLRHRLLANRFGRNIVALLFVSCLTLIAHRAVALRFGQPVPDIVAVDLLVLGLEIALGAALLDRRLGVIAALFLAGSLVVVVAPSLAIAVMAATSIGALGLAVVLWSRTT